MAFTPKNWLDGRDNGANARWNAAAAIDMETRLSNYTDSQFAGSFHHQADDLVTTNTTLNMSGRQSVLWTVTLGGDLKLEITGWSAGASVLLVIRQDATGGRNLQQLPTAKWDGGAIPPSTTAPNAIDIRSFFHDGVDAFGSEFGTAMA